MAHEDQEHEENQESSLNPPPLKYRVSPGVMAGFLIIALFSLVGYFYNVFERHRIQNNYILNNALGGVALKGEPAPNLKMINLKTGTQVSLGELKGQWVLLNVWATWCPPCQKEMPSLDALQKRFLGKLKVVALSVDETEKPVEEFLNTFNPSFSVYFDGAKEASRALGIEKYPETFLINPEGFLVTQFSGPREWGAETSIRYFSKLAL